MSCEIVRRASFRHAILWLLIGLSSACVSVEVHTLKRPSSAIEAEPLLVLVNQGGYDLNAAKDLQAALDSEFTERATKAQTLIVTSDMLREQSAIESARSKARMVLRIMPIAGTRLEGVASRITYDASLHENASDKRVWQGRIEVRSGILQRQLRRRQARAARKLLALMRTDRVLN